METIKEECEKAEKPEQETSMVDVASGSDVKSLLPLSYKLKLFKTCCMLSIYLGMGFWVGVVTPTLVDMTELYNCTYEAFVHSYTMKAVGVMAGSFIGAIVADRFRQKGDLFLFLCNLIGGATCIAVPWMPNLVVLAIIMFINGLSHGTMNVVCSSVCIAIWGEAAPTPIHALHMMFTLGLTIAPSLTVPFLSRDNHTEPPNGTALYTGEDARIYNDSTEATITHTLTEYYTLVNRVIYNTNDVKYQIFNGFQYNVLGTGLYSDFSNLETTSSNSNITTTKVMIPYAFFGGWSVLVSIIFLLFFLFGSTYVSTTVKQKGSIKEMLNPGSVAQGNVKFGLYFLISLFILYIFIQGRDRSVAMFIFVIANKGVLNLSKPLSALLVTAFNLSTAIGRGISGLLSRWISIQALLFSQLILAIIIQVLLIFFGLKSVVWLWLLTCLSAALTGPTYPSVMSWCDRYIEATGVVIAIIDVGIGTGSFVALWISGSLFQRYGAVAVFILGAAFGVSVIIILLPLQTISHLKGDRHKQIQQTVINEEDSEEREPLLE